MKYLILFLLSISVTQASVYKCKDNGKTIYQSTPCSIGDKEHDLGTDISIAKQKAAKAKLNRDMAVYYERKKAERVERNKERIIRAEENKASASYANAKANRAQVYQQSRAAKALEKINDIKQTQVIRRY